MSDVLRSAEAFIGTFDVSGEVVGFTPTVGGEVLEFVPFKAPDGVEGVRKEGSIVMDTAAVEGVMRSGDPFEYLFGRSLLKTPAAMHLRVLSSAAIVEGDWSVLFNAVSGMPQVVARKGDLIRWSCDFEMDGPLVVGRVLARGQKTASGNSTGWQMGAVSDGQGIHGLFQVPKGLAVAGTIDMIIESDDNSGFTSPVTRMTFAQVAAPAAGSFQWLSTYVAGGITDDFWRAKWTSASIPDHTVSCAFGIF